MTFSLSPSVHSSVHSYPFFTFSLFVTFLAVMSSSRSDNVIKCACVCVSRGVILFSLEHSKHLKQGCFRGSHGSHKSDSKMFQGGFNGVLSGFQICFEGVSRML